MKVMYSTNILAFHTPQTLPQEPQNYWIFYIPIYVVQCKPLPMGRIFFKFFFVDDYSKYTNIFFLFKKFDTCLNLQKYKTKPKNHTSGKIKMWHFDNGGEFISQHFHQFCSDYGIQCQFATIYNPTYYGVVELKNQTLVKFVQNMFKLIQLSHSLYWTKVSTITCHLQIIYIYNFFSKHHPI
jgi:transposase InsO family protein